MKRINMQHIMRVCLCAGVLTLGASILEVFAQGVGINTTTPDPSAALDIKSSDKGILIPQVQLQSLIDQFTIPAPAHGLLVYHMGNNLGGKGFFYNSGLSNGPVWKRVGELTYPYYHGGSEDVLFNLENYKQNSTTIRAYSISGNALEIAGGLKIAGPGQSPGLGKVLTSDAQGNAKWEGAVAFKVSGIAPNGNQIMASSPAKIPFQTEEYDLDGSYNDITGIPHNTFFVPVTGIYHFDASVEISTIEKPFSEDDRIILTLQKIHNGTTEIELSKSSALFRSNTAVISADVKLFQGDQVFVKIAHTNSGKHISLIDPSFSGKLLIKQ